MNSVEPQSFTEQGPPTSLGTQIKAGSPLLTLSFPEHISWSRHNALCQHLVNSKTQLKSAETTSYTNRQHVENCWGSTNAVDTYQLVHFQHTNFGFALWSHDVDPSAARTDVSTSLRTEQLCLSALAAAVIVFLQTFSIFAVLPRSL